MYDVASCLAAWSHVPSRGVSVWGVSLQRPPDKDPLYGKERTGRILLECILVVYVHKLSWAKDTSYL